METWRPASVRSCVNGDVVGWCDCELRWPVGLQGRSIGWSGRPFRQLRQQNEFKAYIEKHFDMLPSNSTGQMPIHSVSGHSSGGDMAVLHFVAFAASCLGTGVNAGAPYGCNLLDRPELTCGTPDIGQDWDANGKRMTSYMVARGAAGKIDPLSNMKAKRVLLFSGTKDTLVYPVVMQAVYDQFAPYVGAATIKSVFNIPAQHAWVTTDRSDHACGYLGAPFINYCNYGLSGEVLSHVLGETLKPAVQVS